MKIYFGLFVCLLCLISCHEPSNTAVEQLVTISDVDYGECDNNRINSDTLASTVVNYIYRDGSLILNHINATFNCCFDDIVTTIVIEGSRIEITEKDIKPNCKCLCLRNINYSINGIKPGIYRLKINEPYLNENDEAIEFVLDIKEGATGSIFFERSSYPWVI